MTQHSFQIAAYFPEWEVRRPFLIKDIDERGLAPKITMINYAFGIPAPDSAGAVVAQFRNAEYAYQQAYTAEMSVDGEADDPHQPLRGHFNQIKKLKAKYPHIKVVVSLGGWTESTWFSDAARTPEARQKFVKSCLDLYVHGHLPEENGAGGLGVGAGVFDGIDIDWEYPIGDGLPETHVHPEDDKNFVLLLREFRRQYAEIGREDLLLTAAVPGPKQAGQYAMSEAHPLLDLVQVMTYDLRGDWAPTTGHHTNLYNAKQDPAPEEARISADATLKIYRDRFGVPARKLLIGAAFYGRGWKGVPPENHGLFQPGEPVGQGVGNYYALARRTDQGFTRHWDDSAKAPWLYSESEGVFITYDDPKSVGLKAQYVRDNAMGGVMFWEITGDDAYGTLINAIYNELYPAEPEEGQV